MKRIEMKKNERERMTITKRILQFVSFLKRNFTLYVIFMRNELFFPT